MIKQGFIKGLLTVGMLAFAMLVVGNLQPEKAYAALTTDSGKCFDGGGEYNAVVYVKVVDHNGNFLHYATDFDFSVQTYAKAGATDPKGVNYNEYRQNAIISWNGGTAQAFGPGPKNLSAKLKADGTPANNQGNMCDPNNTPGNKALAYAFRSGDGTQHHFFPAGTKDKKGDWTYPNGPKNGLSGAGSNNGNYDNNGSLSLSCLSSEKTSFRFKGIAVGGEARSGSFSTGTVDAEPGVNDTINHTNDRIFLVYKLDAPVWDADPSSQIKRNSGAYGTSDLANVQPGETVTFKHTIKNLGPDSLTQKVDGSVSEKTTVQVDLADNTAKDGTKFVEDTISVLGTGTTAVGNKICQTLSITPNSSTNSAAEAGNKLCFTIVAAPAGTCSVSADPVDLEPGQATTITASISITNLYKTPTGTITFNGNARTFSTPTGSASTGTWTMTATYPTTAPLTPGTSKITTVFTPTSGTPAATGGCNAVDLRVSAKPIVKAYGGDVRTGWGPAGDVCTNSVAAITSWNTGGTYASAGAQFGAQAMGLLTGFASAQSSYAATGNYPKIATGLSFANTVSVLGEVYGGKFNDTSSECIDYTPTVDASSSREDYTTSDYKSPTTPYTVPNGVDKVIYVKGRNAYIKNNILYSAGTYTSLASIPSYKLVVVGGNIYIDPSVTQLSGMFVAQKSGGAGGTIYTCASEASGVILPTTVGYYTVCNKPLQIYGSFVAKQVKLQRTSYSRTNDPALTAEQFIYGPEEWLGQAGGTTLGKPDAITSLPPTL